MEPVKNNRDPLDLARKHLDFAAMAAAAPSSKDILFKAQTMVPLSPTKPWWKVSKLTILSMVVIALAFVPWMPSKSSLAMLNVQFEQQFERPEAQEVVLNFVKEMPEYALLGVEYGIEKDGKVEPGQLNIRVNAVNRSPQDVQDRVNSVIDAYSVTDQPYNIHARQIWVSRFDSPFMTLMHYLGSSSEPRSREDDPLAREILANEAVFAQGLKSQYAQQGIKLEKCGFLNSRSITGDLEYQFTVDGWPRDLGVTVEHYNDLTDHEQLEIRRTAEDFCRSANLRETGMMLASTPQQWMPVIIHVVGADDGVDPRLSAMVQAEMVQPTEAELMSIEFDVEVPIMEALERALPGHEFQLDYEVAHTSYQTGAYYLVKVTVLPTTVSGHWGDRVR